MANEATNAQKYPDEITLPDSSGRGNDLVLKKQVDRHGVIYYSAPINWRKFGYDD